MKHMSLRLWVSLPGGWFAGLLVMPRIPASFGAAGEPAIVLLFVLAIFILYGRIADYAGRSMMRRMIREAESWEMAGRSDEAEKLLRKAVTVLDGFLLSPLTRRRMAARLIALLAPFYMARRTDGPFADMAVMEYLETRPEDTEAAETWLEHVLEGGRISRSRNRIIDLLVRTQPDNRRIQGAAARICLASGRADFTALNAYRRTWRDVLDDEGVLALADLLLKKKEQADWVMDVVAAASRTAPGDRRFADFVNARRRPVHHEAASGGNASLVGRVESIPSASDDHGPRTAPERKTGRPRWNIAISWKSSAAAAGDWLDRWQGKIAGVGRNVISGPVMGRGGPGRRIAAWSLSAFLLLVVLFLLVGGVNHLLSRGAHDVRPVATDGIHPADPPPAAPPGFTVQAAAYLQPEHARRYVEQLQSSGVDAYVLETKDPRRMLYQVRVGRFPDGRTARDYAERLKKEGVIEDYYVANYVRP